MRTSPGNPSLSLPFLPNVYPNSSLLEQTPNNSTHHHFKKLKSTSFHLPLFVLIGGGALLGWKQHRISILRNQSAELTLQLDLSTSRTKSTPGQKPRRRTALDYQEIDWSLVAKELTTDQAGTGIFTSSFKLEEQIRRLSPDELKEGLAALEESDLEEQVIIALTLRLLGILLKKDPKHILLQPSQNSTTTPIWQSLRTYALGRWAKTSPRMALAWFDSQPTATFDAGNYQKLNHSLISSLVVSDFPIALSRFKDIPEPQRDAFFQNYDSFGSCWETKDFADHNLAFRYAELTRLLPDDKKAKISSPLTWLGEQDRPAAIYNLQRSLKGWENQHPGPLTMETLYDYLLKIKPSQSELELCINDVVGSKSLHLPKEPKREPEALRSWLQSELQPTVRPK